MHQPDLIFDIGAHQGDDTAVYLKSGFRVVAIEANPVLVEELHLKFKAEIREKKVFILNCIISEKDHQQQDFFLHQDATKSSLFSDGKNIKIAVSATTLRSVISEYGIPFYCKIDIEDADYFAIKSLDKAALPCYTSVEISGKPIEKLEKNTAYLFRNLDQLKSLGYTHFKLVDQQDLVILTRASYYRQKIEIGERIKNRCKKLLGIDSRTVFIKRFGLPKDAEVSGYTSDKLGGTWLTYDEVYSLIQFHFNEYVIISGNKNYIFWIDIHAKL